MQRDIIKKRGTVKHKVIYAYAFRADLHLIIARKSLILEALYASNSVDSASKRAYSPLWG
jgi:hypothetical protein